MRTIATTVKPGERERSSRQKRMMLPSTAERDGRRATYRCCSVMVTGGTMRRSADCATGFFGMPPEGIEPSASDFRDRWPGHAGALIDE